MNDEPQILIQPSTVSCPGHGEHLRAQWPKGFVMFSMTIIQKMLESEEFLNECRPAPEALADTAKINEVLAKRPACYFVSRETIREALMESSIGRIALCDICGKSGMGGPYTVNDMGKFKELSHVCFECALDTGERMHSAYPNGGVWNE